MVDVGTALMVAPSAASFCVVAAGARRRVQSLLPGGVMLVSMLVLSVPGLPGPASLTAAVAVLATVPVSLARPPGVVSASPMQVHRALSALLMSVLIVIQVVASSTHHADETMPQDMAGMAGMHSAATAGSQAVLIGAGALAGYLAFSASLVARRPPISHTRRLSDVGEITMMTFAVLVMAAMV